MMMIMMMMMRWLSETTLTKQRGSEGEGREADVGEHGDPLGQHLLRLRAHGGAGGSAGPADGLPHRPACV